MKAISAGILLYRFNPGLEVFICKPGGPFKSLWTIPKGGIEYGEELYDTAIRELEEETGIKRDEYGELEYLDEVRQKKKLVHVFIAEYSLTSNPIVESIECKMEWPRKSGNFISFPEIETGAFMSLDKAATLLIEGQVAALNLLEKRLSKEP